MLPFNLLRVQAGKGQIKPVYADINKENLDFATELSQLFRDHIEKRKGVLLAEVSKYETTGLDYRFVRGLSLILQRLCIFQADAAIDPPVIRRLIFEEASRRGSVATAGRRKQVLQSVARQLNVEEEQLEESLYADLDDELVLKECSPVDGAELLKRYNLSLTQTLLFRSTFIEIKVSDHWKEILRAIRYRGLMYSAETRNGVFQITVEGPLSLFKLTQRYGTSMAKILPLIVQSHEWEINGSVVRTSLSGKRIFQLRLTSTQVGDKVRSTPAVREQGILFDSLVEEKFYRDFHSLNLGWKVTREPSPLIVGRHVFIPDFCFEKKGIRVYMEIVGFWTKKYLETKIRKLQQIGELDIIVAADKKLACDKLKLVEGRVIFYKNHVPLKPILDILKNRDELLFHRDIAKLDLTQLRLSKDVVELHIVAEEWGVSEEALKRKLEDFRVEGYTLAGDQFVSNRKLGEIELKLASQKESSLSKVLRLIEDEGVKKPYDVLSALNYGIRWKGLDLNSSSVFKKEE